MLWIQLLVAIELVNAASGSVTTQLTAGKFGLDDSVDITWLQITVEQPYCVTQAVHTWSSTFGTFKENTHSCDKNTVCTCTGTACKGSTLKVSTERNTILPDNAASRTGCQWGDTVLLKSTSFDEQVVHEIKIHEKSDDGTDLLIAKISGGQTEINKDDNYFYNTWLQVTLGKEICVNEVVHNYAIVPDFRHKYSCKKDGACKCESKNNVLNIETCKNLTFAVSGGTTNQERTDCKMGKTFKFVMTNDDSDIALGYGDDVYQNMIISTPSGTVLVTIHTTLLVLQAILASFYWSN